MVNKYFNENEALKKQWRQRYPEGCMIWDGIISPEKWYASDLKLLFVAKEAYDKDANAEDWDIAEEWQSANGLFKVQGANQATQYRIAEWSFAVNAALHNVSSISQQDAKQDNYKACRETMLESAIINIKKVGGKSKSSEQDLKNVACQNADLLEKQLEIINPNIFLFCGTFSILQEFKFRDAIKIGGTNHCYDWKGKLLISFRHPGQGAEIETMYYIFEDINKIPDKVKYLH